MARPPKCRIVECEPSVTFFKPRGIPMRKLEIVTISVEEMEALRLRDVECLNQTEAARRMGISRQTYGRVLSKARRGVANALVMGLGLKIEGGHYAVSGNENSEA